ncbi:MAG: bifunctional UDP-2,4-diacetamido-2,4,6-trideoxy-beta-L-altropyranose hydrolase/GNAT family N-acetyltransferase, partial [Arthrobacter sp.]
AGHVMRSVAVAEQALAEGWDVAFCGRIEHPVARAAVARIGVDTVSLELTSAAIVAAAEAAGARLIHVDSYLPLPDLRTRATTAGLALSSVEDGTYGRRAADLVIDASPRGEDEFRTPDGSLRLLRGLRAAPIRGELLDPRRLWQRSHGPDGLRVLVIMGGTDATGMTARAVEAWIGTGIHSECHVIAQAGDEGFAGVSGNSTIVRHAPGPEVPLLFGTMDLVISGAGTTVWELAALRVPSAIIQLVPNQLAGYDYAVENGFAVGLGSWEDWDDGLARRRLRELGGSVMLRRQLSRAAERVVDGAGARRIIELWRDIVTRPPGVSARRAVPEDASQLFEWRSDPEVRAASRTSGSFSWPSHLAWFKETLANPRRVVAIIENAGRSAAVVRFDLLPEREAGWEVSITVSPDFRGTGMGGRALQAAEDLLLREHPDTEITLVAEMLMTNHASRRLFSAAGYHAPPGTTSSAPSTEGKPEAWGRLEKTCPRAAK